MINRYLRYAFRHLKKNKLFSVINITGLTIGMASSIMILIWVYDELTFDSYHTNIENLYRVMENQYYSKGEVFTFSATPGPMAPKMKEDFPEVVHAARMSWTINELFIHKGKSLYFNSRYVDQDFLDMFTFQVLEGDLTTALSDNSSIVITEEVATAYFGDESAMGKSFNVDNKHDYKVTAVIGNIPANSSFPVDILLPVQVFINDNPWADTWYNNNLRTFLELRPGTEWKEFSDKIKNYIAENRNEDSNVELFLQPYSHIHLYSDFREGRSEGGRIVYVRVFSIVGIFILIIASINFMNLATALSTQRAKEVGIRKIAGSGKVGLIAQFLLETLLIALISLILALILVYYLLPTFNQLTDKNVNLNIVLIAWSVLMAVVTGLMAGIYPAFYISKYQPAKVLKGEIDSGARASVFRKILVIFQFSLSMILISGTLIVTRQMNFIYNRNIGLDKENLIYVPLRQNMYQHYEAIRDILLKNESIKEITVTSQNPITIGNSSSSVEWPGKDPDTHILFSNLFVDHDFIETFGIDIAAGRDFSREYPSDSSNFLINETAAEAMGYSTDSILNEEITYWGERTGRIVGVMVDFNFQSIHVPIEPLIVMMDRERYFLMHLRINMKDFDSIIADLEDIQKVYAPDYPMEYEFLDEDYASLYSSEEKMGDLMDFFAIIAIIISCLGLYGLAAYTTERRTKELGIRKAMGASIFTIISLVSRDYFLLIILAFCIAFPVAWILMENWLENFAFHIDMSVFPFFLAAIIALLLAIITVAYFALKAARTNPVEALRYE